MNLKELSSPIRMYWDVGSGALPESDCRRIADEMAACKILTLQITETSSAVSPSSLAILDTLKNKNIALSFVLPLNAWNKESFELLRGFPIKLLLISTTSPGTLKSLLPIQGQTAGKPPFGVAFGVKRDNFRELPDVLSFCVNHELTCLVLPMQRLICDEQAFLFSAEERRELTARLEKIKKPTWLKIVVHDPFLWRAFSPSVEFPDGGCQAANTMLYISPEADVYPCPSLPIKIGNLRHFSLKELIHGTLKKEIRRGLTFLAEGCRDCSERDQCKGGCRGRAFVLQGSVNRPDPACK